jgi:putative transposase
MCKSRFREEQLVGIRNEDAASREATVRMRLLELAAQRPRFGCRRLHVLLRREGIGVYHRRGARLDREQGLAVRRRTRISL